MPCPGPRLWPGVAVGLSLDATGYSAPRSTGLRRGSAARRWRLRPPLSQHSGVLGGSATCAPWRALCTRVRSPGPVGSSRPPTTTVHRISRSTAIAVTPRSLSHHIHRITQRASHRCPRHHRPDSTRVDILRALTAHPPRPACRHRPRRRPPCAARAPASQAKASVRRRCPWRPCSRSSSPPTCGTASGDASTAVGRGEGQEAREEVRRRL